MLPRRHFALTYFGEILTQLVELIKGRCVRCQEKEIHVRLLVNKFLVSQHPEFSFDGGHLLLENLRFPVHFHSPSPVKKVLSLLKQIPRECQRFCEIKEYWVRGSSKRAIPGAMKPEQVQLRSLGEKEGLHELPGSSLGGDARFR